MKKSIINLLFVSVALVVLVVVSLSAVLEFRSQSEFIQDLFKSRAEQLARAFESGLVLEDRDNVDGLQSKVQKFVLRNSEVIELTVWKDFGEGRKIVASSSLDKVGKVGEGGDLNENEEVLLVGTELFSDRRRSERSCLCK